MSSLVRRSLLDLSRQDTGRIAWADIAKAMSIILVVLWTTIGDTLRVSELLILVRMPLFFFVSGLFAFRTVTATSFREVFRDKFTNLIYLYVIWETLLFLGRGVVGYLMLDWEIDPVRQLTILWDPLLNQWFLYALAWAFLSAWLLRRAPVLLVLIATLGLYAISVASGEWRHLPFLERIVRLFPYFWLGLIAQPILLMLTERYWKLWPIAIAGFFAMAHMIWGSTLAEIAPVTLMVSFTGMLGFIFLSRQIAVVPWIGPMMRVIGASTLYIYVLHKLFLFFAEQLLNTTGLSIPMHRLTIGLLAVAVCTLFGRWINRQPVLKWLFTAPWVASPLSKSRPANPHPRCIRS